MLAVVRGVLEHCRGLLPDVIGNLLAPMLAWPLSDSQTKSLKTPERLAAGIADVERAYLGPVELAGGIGLTVGTPTLESEQPAGLPACSQLHF